MKRIIYIFLFMFIFLATQAIVAQDTTVVQTWDFEESLGDWKSGAGAATIELSTEQALSDTQSVKLVGAADHAEINLENDEFDNIQEGDIVRFNVWISSADLANVNGVQIFWHAPDWAWNNSDWFSGADLTGDEWNVIEAVLPEIQPPVNRIGLQVLAHEASATPTVYVDDITITRITEDDPVDPDLPILVDSWGFLGGRVAGWQITHGDPGNFTLSGDQPLGSGWSAVRGEFASVTPGEGEAIVVTGQIRTEGQGLNQWNAIRYGLFRHDSTGTLEYAGTDTARWTGPENHAYGYLLLTMSGTNERANWLDHGTAGDFGVIYGGSWISTNSAGSKSLGQRDQRLFRAQAPEGLYDYAISVHTQEDGNNQMRFYLIHEDGEYWWGGIVIDTTGVPTESYNGVTFGLNADSDDMTAVHFIDITVDIGEPIALPDPPLEMPPHGVGRIINENRNFELSVPGVTEDEPFWTFNRTAGGANAEFEIVTDEAQSGDRSLRIDFGTWNGTSDVWNVEAVSEPFYPSVGDTIRATVWLKASSDTMLARIYLGLPGGSWQRVPDWGREVVCTLTTEWQMFAFPDYGVIQRDVNHAPDGAMRFGVEMNLPQNDGGVIWVDNAIVRVVAQAPVVSVNPEPSIPLVFNLDQNYPNPFNPATQIRFSLPESADVLLEVFDILGRRVATLINNENYSMGHHTITWDATGQSGSTLSSGVYIYRLQAGSFVETKRMMFLK